eukprot:965142-Amphidinium_carterae.1
MKIVVRIECRRCSTNLPTRKGSTCVSCAACHPDPADLLLPTRMRSGCVFDPAFVHGRACWMACIGDNWS